MEPRILQKGGRKYVYTAFYLNISLFLYNQFRYLYHRYSEIVLPLIW